jgi:protocatechuate 3,4-dioxygenase alpha subunit
MAGDTPFQTVGPFFSFALVRAGGHRLATDTTPGRRVVIAGRLIDGAGAPIDDALIEIWQADAEGRYHHPDDPRASDEVIFDGFGRVATDADGGFSFDTIVPGPTPGPGGRSQAPHILVSVLARGILTRLTTRLYFEDEPATSTDPILERVPVNRRSTLIARRDGDHRYRFDIVVQGPHETVFFDV